jgi:hypothetical protein
VAAQIGAIVAALAFALIGGLLLRTPLRRAWRKPRFEEARRRFHWQREHLEAKFLQLSQTGARRATPRWADCEFDDDVAYVRNRFTGELSAFVAVNIALENPADCPRQAQAGESLEGNASSGASFDLAGNLRAATAVFRFDRDHWETDGRAIFNLSPSETIRFYQHDLEMIGEEVAERR